MSTMDYPKFISNQKEESICIQRVNKHSKVMLLYRYIE